MTTTRPGQAPGAVDAAAIAGFLGPYEPTWLPAIDEGGVPRQLILSPSQVETHRLCPRKWWMKHVERRPEPQTRGAFEGQHAHRQAELRQEGLPHETLPHLEALRLYLPPPKDPAHLVEVAWAFVVAGVPWRGRIDLLNLSGHHVDPMAVPRLAFDAGRPIPEVIDLKFGKSAFWLNGSTLRESLQMNAYGLAVVVGGLAEEAMPLLRGAIGGGPPPSVRYSHLCAERTPPHDRAKVTVMRTAQEVVDWARTVAEPATRAVVATASLRSVEETGVNQLRGCRAFGGCAYESICTKRLGPEEIMSDIFDTLFPDEPAAAAPPPAAPPPQPAVAPAVAAPAPAAPAADYDIFSDVLATPPGPPVAAPSPVTAAVAPRAPAAVLSPATQGVVSTEAAREAAAAAPVAGPAAAANGVAAAAPVADGKPKRGGKKEATGAESATVPPAASPSAAAPTSLSAALGGGVVLYLNAVAEGRFRSGRLEPYVSALASRVAEELGLPNLLCRAPDSSPAAFGGWRGILAARVLKTPPPDGDYAVTVNLRATSDDPTSVVVKALLPRAAHVVFGHD